MIEIHAPRCPDCEEPMWWATVNPLRAECRWCKAYGKPEEEKS